MGITDYVYQSDYPWSDVRFQLVVSVGIAILMYVVQEYWAAPPLARWIDRLPKKSKKDDNKFPAHICNLVMHLPVAFISAWIVYNENWYNEPEKVWDNFPNQPQPIIFYILYLWCIGYHFQRLVRLLVAPGHDWIEMGAHHIITMYLLLVSIDGNYIRIGIIVLMVNDVSDIFVYLAKATSVMESKAILFFFPLLMLSWFFWRIHQFALVVIPIADMHPPGCDVCRAAVYGMYVLVMLNVFWLSMFFRMAYRLVARGETRDFSTDAKSVTSADSVHASPSKALFTKS